ncbi:hypothetical protein Syun_029898 [Stephania yunnanensis]|uniref:Uncharacterized protein n=1 Tax=Stephania yunnanensis TaxID=152371 RepID=A0AAP0EER5_9MAGN
MQTQPSITPSTFRATVHGKKIQNIYGFYGHGMYIELMRVKTYLDRVPSYEKGRISTIIHKQ